ncbi:hypothetical protein JOB18_041559 [Solea senegalensis]|uniref:Uncharacterized protein n=1 Tax=Solea senegalensis TaxID=28829 RepID=A0AAV6S3Y9_SOLSE|nr:hypothetical protein JOB18_041559 [Solea senegalensis]
MFPRRLTHGDVRGLNRRNVAPTERKHSKISVQPLSLTQHNKTSVCRAVRQEKIHVHSRPVITHTHVYSVELAEKLVELAETLAELVEKLVELVEMLAELVEKPFQLAEKLVELAEKLVELVETLAQLAEKLVELVEKLVSLVEKLVELFKELAGFVEKLTEFWRIESSLSRS